MRQTRVGDMSMWKACAFSNATRNGVFAAQLARRGMMGPSPIFEGEKGFMKLVAGSFELFGVGESAARLPGLIFLIATTLMVMRIASPS